MCQSCRPHPWPRQRQPRQPPWLPVLIRARESRGDLRPHVDLKVAVEGVLLLPARSRWGRDARGQGGDVGVECRHPDLRLCALGAEVRDLGSEQLRLLEDRLKVKRGGSDALLSALDEFLLGFALADGSAAPVRIRAPGLALPLRPRDAVSHLFALPSRVHGAPPTTATPG